jgi:hypothetical protein
VTSTVYQAAAGRIRSVSGLLAVLSRLVPLAGRMVRWVRGLALASAAAVAVIVLSAFVGGLPSVTVWTVVVLAAVVLGLVPVVLWLFADALADVLALPGWLRASPRIVRDHGAELADLMRQARPDGSGARWGRVHTVRDGWRAGRLLLEAHDEVPGYGAALRLISVPFLVAVALAALGAVAEIVLAPSVLVVAWSSAWCERNPVTGEGLTSTGRSEILAGMRLHTGLLLLT